MYIKDSTLCCSSYEDIWRDAEVKIVWKEEDRTKVGRGKITNDDENFVYLTGEKGTVIVNKSSIIAIKQ